MQKRSNARVPGLTHCPVAAPAAAGHRPLLLALALAAGFTPLTVRPQPTGAQAIVGSASLSQQGNKLVVTTQNGAGGFSAINWQSFSVPGGTTTYFAQPGAASTSINRVVGQDPSAIFGTLGSNGRIVLVNPAGITVGAGAVVDTAGFTASTLRMSDADALAGRMRFEGSAGGVLQVDGQVIARSGDVVLIGAKVQTGASALIQSPQGATVLAAGQKVEVTGRGLEGIVFQVQAPADEALNLGTLQGDAVGIFAGTLKHSGLVQAQAVSVEGGRVVLKASDQALVTGAVQAQAMGGAGGRVDVLGAKVGLLAGTSIDTSNTQGGGQIRIGGDYQGGNAMVANAQVTYVDSAAQLKANATDQGNGGKVIVWADDTTHMHGTIQANAGPNGGDGGFVETSGKRALDVTGARVSAGAARGKGGDWLLDPSEITIAATAAPSSLLDLGNGPDFTSLLNTTASTLLVSTLNAALDSNTSVTVTTDGGLLGLGSGNIVFDGPVSLARTVGGPATLTLNAWNDIVFRSGSTVDFQAIAYPSPTPPPVGSRLDVNLNARGAITTEANATVNVAGQTSIDQANLLVSGGKTWTNNGALNLGTNSQLVLHDGTAAATFVNAASGTVAGTPGAAGGIRGASSSQLGNFSNAGNVTLASGTFSVATLNQTGGTVDLSGSADLTVTNGYTSTGGNLNFTGNSLSLTQQSGNLTLASTGPAINASGSVALFANNGNVVLDRAVSAAGELAIGAGSVTSSTGTVSLNAAVSADKVHVSAWGADAAGNGIIQKAPITASELIVISNAGRAVLTNGGNKVDALAASGAGLQFVDKVDLLTIRPLTSVLAGTGAAGLTSTGAVRVTNSAASGAAGSGSIFIDAASTVAAETVSINAAGDLHADAAITTNGKSNPAILRQGDIDLQAGGSIAFYTISSSGPSSGASPGTAGGAVTMVAGTGISGTSIDASGTSSPAGTQVGAGGNAGDVTLNGGTALSVSSISATGGSGGYGVAAGGRGGNGGVVSLTAGGDLRLDGTAIDASGGTGGAHGAIGGAGGTGGNILLASSSGGVFMNAMDPNYKIIGSAVRTEGGTGGDTSGLSATDRAGAGGVGGTIRIMAATGSELLGSLSTRGGDGGYAPGAGSLARAGGGGAGGAISATLSSPGATVTVGGSVFAGGAVGGRAADYDPVLYDWTNIDPARAGAAGTTSTFSASAPGGVLVRASRDLPTLGPSSGDAAASLNLVAKWTNGGTLFLDPGAWVRNTEPFTNNGAVQLGSGSLFALGTYDQAFQTFVPGSVTFTNAGTGLLQGWGTVQGNVVNAGTLSPGSASGGIGALTVAGDLVLQSTSKLLLDVAPNVPRVAGTTHDQLVVLGNLTLGGGLQVNAVPEVVLPPAPSPMTATGGVVARQVFAGTLPDPYVLITAASVTAGSTFATATAPLDVQPLAMLNDATVLRPLFPMPPAPVPVPVVLATTAQPLVPNEVVTFLTFFTQQILLPAAPVVDEDGKLKGKPDIVSTDLACRPV